MGKQQWRKRVRGTKRQIGKSFVLDRESTQTKKIRLPKADPARDINVNVNVTLSPTKAMRLSRKAVETEKKKAEEERPISILDPRTHPLRVHEIESKIPGALPIREGIETPVSGFQQEITVGGQREPSAMEEIGKLAETGSGIIEKRAVHAKERRAERVEEKRYQEGKAEREKERAEVERKEAVERQDKWKKEQEAKKKASDEAKMNKWIKRADKDKGLYAKDAVKVAKKQK
jgi:hypothetical protein